MPILLHAILTVYSARAFFHLRRRPCVRRLTALITRLLTLLAMTLAGAILLAQDAFALIQFMAWTVFLYAPLILLAHAGCSRRSHPRLSTATALVAGLILMAGLDAFLVEPQWLQVTHHTLTSDKLDRSLRIAVLADIQTDHPGAYDARVFQRVRAEQPDLILFLGDYIQLQGPAYGPAALKLNQLLLEAHFQPPLGMIAIQGNQDPQDWSRVFAELPVTMVENTETMDLGPLTVTGLNFNDSCVLSGPIPGQDKYHLVLGHCPDFALGQVQADLLLAGHTHGGQVRLPLIGPLLTFSDVPRSWAAGLHEIAPGKFLCVSRGLGMERHHAPRMRFLCRPELVILDLMPE